MTYTLSFQQQQQQNTITHTHTHIYINIYRAAVKINGGNDTAMFIDHQVRYQNVNV